MALPDDPFPVGSPVDQEDVVDRDAFIDEVVTRLQHRHSVILAAPRRLGKTSIANEALRRLEATGDVLTASVDLSTTPTLRHLAERLTTACLANVTSAARAMTGAREALANLARMPEVRAKMHDLELSVAIRPERERDPDELVEEALHLPERMAQRDGRRFVVMLDEFQSATGIGGDQLLARMRGIFQLQRHAAFLFLGSQGGMMTQLFGARNQPFFRFATPLDLPPIPGDAWRSYIHAKVTAQGKAIANEAVDVILEYTDGHPYDTMQVAFETFLRSGQAARISVEMALGGCRDAQARMAAIFEAEVDAVGPRARAVLGRIARGDPLYEGERSNAAVQTALRVLERAGFVRRIGRGRYAFVERMLARHLLR